MENEKDMLAVRVWGLFKEFFPRVIFRCEFLRGLFQGKMYYWGGGLSNARVHHPISL